MIICYSGSSMKVLLLLSFIICGTMAAPSDASTGLSEFLRGNRLFSADLYKVSNEIFKHKKFNYNYKMFYK